ncbi:MAG: hypothetical protein AB7E16_02405 [Candidatus Izemoplasmatales bacterium]
MKLTKLWFIPIILIIVSITSSIIAFDQGNKLNLGYLYIDGKPKEIIYEGEYLGILGNTGEAYKIKAESLSDFLRIVTYDTNSNVLDEYKLLISINNGNHDSSLITTTVSDQAVVIDEMEDYLFTVNLKKDNTYVFDLQTINDNPDTEDIDLALANIPENVYNLKSLMEGVSFTTLIFALLSTITIGSIIYIKKNK